MLMKCMGDLILFAPVLYDFPRAFDAAAISFWLPPHFNNHQDRNELETPAALSLSLSLLILYRLELSNALSNETRSSYFCSLRPRPFFSFSAAGPCQLSANERGAVRVTTRDALTPIFISIIIIYI